MHKRKFYVRLAAQPQQKNKAMPVPQTKYREVVFQLLYSTEEGGEQSDEILSLIMRELEVSKRTVREARERSYLILGHKAHIDTLISTHATEYRLERIPSVERNALRLGIYELLYDEEIPEKVAISEAMRLVRKFSTPEAALFVNAIMDQIYQEQKAHSPAVAACTD